MVEEAKRGQLAGALVRSVNMTTPLVWPQGWGKAEVATGVPMCSVFEQAAGNGTRACLQDRRRKRRGRRTVTAAAATATATTQCALPRCNKCMRGVARPHGSPGLVEAASRPRRRLSRGNGRQGVSAAGHDSHRRYMSEQSTPEHAPIAFAQPRIRRPASRRLGPVRGMPHRT